MNSTVGMTEEQIAKIIRRQVCAECGALLKRSLDNCQTVIACSQFWQHEGIAKPYENKEPNIIERRERMTTEIGEQKTQALEKYSGIISLTKAQAREIIDTVWPQAGKASPVEVYRAVSICADYGLNPLMKHVYLIPFWNEGKKSYDYVTVLGIGANRLIASRKHSYSYIDDTPRLMTDEEQQRVFGEVQPNRLVAVTVLKDMKTGATARGYGNWPKDVDPKGIEKGNTRANMAFIRSERQALDRLYPADMPKNVEVVDEKYEVTATVEPPTEPPPGDAAAENVQEAAAEPSPEVINPPASPPAPPEPVEATQAKDATIEGVDMDWLRESLNKLSWTTVVKWLKNKYPQATGNRVSDIVKSLTVEQRKDFAKEVVSRLEMN